MGQQCRKVVRFVRSHDEIDKIRLIRRRMNFAGKQIVRENETAQRIAGNFGDQFVWKQNERGSTVSIGIGQLAERRQSRSNHGFPSRDDLPCKSLEVPRFGEFSVNRRMDAAGDLAAFQGVAGDDLPPASMIGICQILVRGREIGVRETSPVRQSFQVRAGVVLSAAGKCTIGRIARLADAKISNGTAAIRLKNGARLIPQVPPIVKIDRIGRIGPENPLRCRNSQGQIGVGKHRSYRLHFGQPMDRPHENHGGRIRSRDDGDEAKACGNRRFRVRDVVNRCEPWKLREFREANREFASNAIPGAYRIT